MPTPTPTLTPTLTPTPALTPALTPTPTLTPTSPSPPPQIPEIPLHLRRAVFSQSNAQPCAFKRLLELAPDPFHALGRRNEEVSSVVALGGRAHRTGYRDEHPAPERPRKACAQLGPVLLFPRVQDRP